MSVKIDGSNGTDVAQLRAPDGDPVAVTIDALGKLGFPAQGQSLAAEGYVKLPGGLIVQWGSNAGVGSSDIQLAFPIPFPTALLGVYASMNGSPATTEMLSIICDLNGGLASFAARPRFNNGAVIGVASQPFNWLALGY